MSRSNRIKIFVVLGIVLIILGTAAVITVPRAKLLFTAAVANPGIAVHFIDVGDADSTLIVCDGRAMLIDGGNIDDKTAADYVQSQGITKLDYMVGTHPHADHMGGLSEVLSRVGVDRVLCSMDSSHLGVFKHFQREVEKKGKKIEAPKPGDTFKLGSATITALSPNKEYSNLNNMSLVLRIEYGDVSFLIEGDAQEEAEQGMIQDGLAKRVTVLRVGHHGSNDASSEAYLKQVKPSYAVIPCGKNEFGHPHKQMLKRLANVGAEVYRTDEMGTVTALSDGKQVIFKTAGKIDLAA